VTEIVTSKFRQSIPPEHRGSVDTRLRWLWMQRLGTVQSVWKNSGDWEDQLAATIILQAVMGADLNSIQLLLTRLEGGAQEDEIVSEGPLLV